MFIFYNKDNGNILGISTNKDNMLSDGIGTLETDEQITCNDYYIENDSVIKIPPSPGDNYFFDYGKKEWVLDNIQLVESINAKRHDLLFGSDWTDTVSAQTRLPNYQQWQDYRQALRDITNQDGFPLNIVWPNPPELL